MCMVPDYTTPALYNIKVPIFLRRAPPPPCLYTSFPPPVFSHELPTRDLQLDESLRDLGIRVVRGVGESKGAYPAMEEGGGCHKASVLGFWPLVVPIALSPLLILTPCGSEHVLVVSTEPLDDLSYWTTPGSAVPETGCCLCR